MPLRILGVLLLLVGVVAGVALSRANARERWVSLAVALPLAAGQSTAGTLRADRDAFYEIQIEVDATLDPVALERYVTVRERPSPLGIGWQVEGPAGVVAVGDAVGYLYIERGPRSSLGRLKRVLLQMPYGRNDAHRRSFGLRGGATVARGLGRFRGQAGETYTIRARSVTDNVALERGDPQLVVRPERRRWQSHFARVRHLGYASWAALALGLALAGLSSIRRRDPARG